MWTGPSSLARRGSATPVVLAGTLVVLALGAAACGGSASTSSATHSTSAPAPTAASAAPTGSSVSTGPVQGSLTAHDHAPKVGRPWHYTVKVTDAAGHPLSGTVDIEFTFAGQVVGHDTPPTHRLRDGHWQDNLKFPAAAVGQPLSVQAVVHTRVGSITLDWPVTAGK